MNPPHLTPHPTLADSPPARRTVHIVDDALFDQHRSRGHHPERPERLGAARRAVERCVAAGLGATRLTSRDASDEEIVRAHAPEYLEALERLRGHHAALDLDTYLAPASVDAARRAAGSAVALVEALLAGSTTPDRATGMALVRPPGHHATRDTGMGFCLLNNVAIAALAALEVGGLSRVAVIDFDVHHGNGTQDIFWRDPRALFISLQQWPCYPGTGAVAEIGEGPGAGHTVNIPLSEGAGDAVYEAAFNEIVVPLLDEYAPELILVSAGFDAHRRDPLAGMDLTETGYASMARKLAGAADRTAHGRLGLVLEGGYDLAALEGSIIAVLLAVAGAEDLSIEIAGPSSAGPSSVGPSSVGPSSVQPVSPRHRAELDRARHQALRHWTTL